MVKWPIIKAHRKVGFFVVLNIQEINMFKFLKQLFCAHEYEHESDIFVQIECRKCGKLKK